MHPTQRHTYERRARVLKALAHPTRLFLVDQLAQGERCVCDLTALAGADMSTISKHLAQLRDAGVVQQRKSGNQVFYRLAVPCARDFLLCVDGVLRAEQAALSPFAPGG